MKPFGTMTDIISETRVSPCMKMQPGHKFVRKHSSKVDDKQMSLSDGKPYHLTQRVKISVK